MELEIETPELQIEPAPQGATELELEPVNDSTGRVIAALEALPIVEILPADFQLPILTRFVPNKALRTAVEQSAAAALSVNVVGVQGLKLADAALEVLRAAVWKIDTDFAEPARIAFELHRNVTGTRGKWQAPGVDALKVVGDRVFKEKARLEAEELAENRRRQAAADQQERERVAKAADEAAKSDAPAEVVEQLRREATTATAAPVSTRSSIGSALSSSTTVKAWKARIVGTPGTDEPNPNMDALSAPQKHQAILLLKAIVEGKAPIGAIAFDWSYLNSRAKADKSEFANYFPGLEAFEQGSTKAKPRRGGRG